MEALANQGSWGKCLPTFEFVPAFVKKVSYSKLQEENITPNNLDVLYLYY